MRKALARRVNPQPILNTMKTLIFIFVATGLFYITTNKTLSQMTETDCKSGIIAACQR